VVRIGKARMKVKNARNRGILATKEVTPNEHTQQVVKALNSEKFIWRTVSGISKETLLPENIIEIELDKLKRKGVVVVSTRKDITGRILYTTPQRYKSSKNLFNRVLTVLSDKVK
jgi:hypothetical protein